MATVGVFTGSRTERRRSASWGAGLAPPPEPPRDSRAVNVGWNL